MEQIAALLLPIGQRTRLDRRGQFSESNTLFGRGARIRTADLLRPR